MSFWAEHWDICWPGYLGSFVAVIVVVCMMLLGIWPSTPSVSILLGFIAGLTGFWGGMLIGLWHDQA